MLRKLTIDTLRMQGFSHNLYSKDNEDCVSNGETVKLNLMPATQETATTN